MKSGKQLMAWVLLVVAATTVDHCEATCAATTDCPVGDFCEVILCQPCSTGYYRSSEAQTECTACAPGYYTDDPTESCKACEAGKYQENTARSTCITCGIGFYSHSKDASTKCNECNTGQYQDDAGQSTCKECLAGMSSSSHLLRWFPNTLPGFHGCS